MTRIAPSIDTKVPTDPTGRVVTIAAVIGALYYGAEILIPVALAILLSFALAPAVKLLHKLGLGRLLPVLITVLFTFVVLAGLTALIASQLRDLSNDFPRYERTVVGKVQALRGLADSRAAHKFEDIIGQINRAMHRTAQDDAAEKDNSANAAAPGPHAQVDKPTQAPMPVQIVPPAMGPLEAVALVLAPLVHPLSIAFVVLVFVVFILLQREDLRNRAIRLFGASDLQRTTAAIDDGAKRLSRYLLTQCALNTLAGTAVGFSAWLIGIPSPILIGIVFASARFVPYIGPVIGAFLPLGLATAVDPGWTMVLWMMVALGAIEVTIGQIVEPFAYGHNTGLSPIAVVLSATFWTVLWGPIGLLLSTPLTVCLVVLGRHVENLAFLEVLLGDTPPLTPAEVFYQRMLANDPIEAADQAQQCLRDMSVAHYYDEVALPGLLMAQDDATAGQLDNDRQVRIKEAALEVVDDLAEEAAEGAEPKEKPHLFRFGRTKTASAKDVSLDDFLPEHVPEQLRAPGSVLCIGARGPLDDIAAAMLAQVFASHGIGGAAESFSKLSKTELPDLDVSKATMIVVSALDGSSAAYLRFVMRRLRRHAPNAEIVVGAWWRRDGYRDADDEIDEAIRQPKLASFLDAVRFCFADRSETAEPPGRNGTQPRLSVAS